MAKSARRSRGTAGPRTQRGGKTSPKASAVRNENRTARGGSSARRTTKPAAKPARSRKKSASRRAVHRTAGASSSTIVGEKKGKLERAQLPRQTTKAGRGRPAAEANEGKYVYCVIKSEHRLSFGTLG